MPGPVYRAGKRLRRVDSRRGTITGCRGGNNGARRRSSNFWHQNLAKVKDLCDLLKGIEGDLLKKRKGAAKKLLQSRGRGRHACRSEARQASAPLRGGGALMRIITQATSQNTSRSVATSDTKRRSLACDWHEVKRRSRFRLGRTGRAAAAVTAASQSLTDAD